jgi:hypothetical protein
MHSKENNPGRNELKRIIGLVLDSPEVVLGSESLRSWFLLYIRTTLFTQRNNLKDLLSMVAFQILFAFKKNLPRGGGEFDFELWSYPFQKSIYSLLIFEI